MRAMRRSFLLGMSVILLAGAWPALGARLAFESPLVPREIKACVLDAAGSANADLFVTLGRSDFRPVGWSFVNPLAPPDKSPAAPGGWGVPSTSPAYWVVPLTAIPPRALVGLDVIYLPVSGTLNITAGEQENGLLQAVENGALLWVDQIGATPGVSRLQPPRVTVTPPPTGPVNPVPFVFAPTAAPVAGRAIAETRTALFGVSRSDLFNTPFRIEPWEANQLGTGDFRVVWPYTDAGGQVHRTDVDFYALIEALDAGGGALGPTMLLAPYGRGAILVSAGNAGERVVASLAGAMKFAFNVMHWSFAMRQQGPEGGRGAAATATAPLDLRWQYPLPGGQTLGPVVAAPLAFHGRVYVLAARGATNAARLVCLDPHPEQDLDGDGNRDDGVVDFSTGLPYDVVWEFAFPTGLSPKSSAVVGAYCPVTGGATTLSIPVVLCTTSSISPGNNSPGQVWCLNALTGQGVWDGGMRLQFDATPYAQGAMVCDMSSPVVNNGYIFFTASEYHQALPAPGGSEAQRTYGRAWCIDLATGGQLANGSDAGGAQWVYPDRDLDRDGTVGPPADYPEPQRVLPPFNDPEWIAAVGRQQANGTELPRVATPAPVITSAAYTNENAASGGGMVDALMLVSTAVSHSWNGSDIITEGWNSWSDHSGGSTIALVPTPLGGNGNNPLDPRYTRLNAKYYAIDLNTPATNPPGWVVDDPATPPAMPALAIPYDQTFPAPIAHFWTVNGTDSGVRQYLANRCAMPGADPLLLQRGDSIELEYSPANRFETYWLPGPVRWQRKYGHNEGQLCGGLNRGDLLYAPTLPAVQFPWAYPPVTALNPTTLEGVVRALDTDSGVERWRLDPYAVLPPGVPPVGNESVADVILATPAHEDGTLVATVTRLPAGGGAPLPLPRAAVLGLRENLDLQIRAGRYAEFGPDPVPDSVQVGTVVGPNGMVVPAVTLRLLDAWDPARPQESVVPPGKYTVDLKTRTIRIPPEYAHDVDVGVDNAGNPAPSTPGADPVVGRAVLVEWTDDSGNAHGPELHTFAPAHTFAYVPGFIKLRHYPVDFQTVQVFLADNTPDLADNVPVMNVAPGEPLRSFGGRSLLPNGWLDLRNAYIDRGGNNLPVYGLTVVVTYTGFCERAIGWTPPTTWPPAVRAVYTPDANGFTRIPNPGLSLPAEVTQVPVGFGPTFSAPTFTGNTILVGTEGYDMDWNGPFVAPPGATPDGGGGVPAVIGPAETLLALNYDPIHGDLWGRMTRPAIGAPGQVPVVSGPVTVSGDDVLVGSRTMQAPATPDGYGYVSSLATERTLIAAGSRIVECVGSRPVRTITGYRQGGTYRPFGQLAKATRTPEGDILVVDSGNNQVLEVDAQGRLVWPTGPTAGDAKLLVNRPTDAWRYETWHDLVNRAGPVPVAGTDGAKDTCWQHTVVADAGNRRILEIVTKPAVNGVPTPPDLFPPGATPTQYHEVYVVSPEAVPATVLDPTARPNEFIELEYQTAQPILDPRSGELWGYLATAANCRQPLIVAPPGWDTAGRFYPARVNPTGPVLGARIGARGEAADVRNATWDAWTFLYDLRFSNIRQAGFVHYGGDLFGAGAVPNTFMWVVASAEEIPAALRGAYAALPAEHMGVYEFNVSAAAPGLRFRYTRADYVDPVSGIGWVPLPDASGNWQANGSWDGKKLTKQFFPVSAQRLPDGDYLICNYAGAMDNLTARNLEAPAIGRSLASEVFRVTVNRNPPSGPPPVATVYGRNIIPDPCGPPWPEPLSLVAWAER